MATPEKDLQKDIEAIRGDIAALAQTIGKLAADTAEVQARMRKNVRKAASSAAEAGEDLIADTADAAVDAAMAGMSSLEAEIKRNPLTAVLTALGIGFVVGLVGRR